MITPFHAVHQSGNRGQYEAAGAILRAGVTIPIHGGISECSCLVYAGSVKVSFRSKGRVASGVVLLFVVSAIMVPLFVACAILASESPMPHEQFIRISRATNMLGWLCLLVQVGAGWLVYSGYSIQKVLVRRLLWLAGILLSAVICSFVCGFLVSGVAEHKWYDIA
jgi:hypothetical protein